MKITEDVTIEQCISGTGIMEYRLDGPVSDQYITYLGTLGRLEYFPKFLRPFFRVTLDNKYIIKGVLGNTFVQVMYLNYSDELERSVRASLQAFPES